MSEKRFLHISSKGQVTKLTSLDEALQARTRGGYIWLDFENPSRAELETLIEPLGLHPLAIEDCLDDNQVPKLEDFTGNTFILFNRYHYANKKVAIEEVDFFLGKDFLVSVAAHAADQVAHKRLDDAVRIEQPNIGRGADYLLHVVLDHIVDDKLVAIEALQDELDRVEEEGLKRVSAFKPAEILHLRRDLMAIRKSLSHEREIMVKICRKDSPYISDKAIYHFRDIYDHLVKFVEVIEVCREMIATLMELYLSLVNNELARLGNRTNQVVRRLTFVTTVFMPLSFFAGVGGMSEWSMMTGPENWRVAYPLFLAAMGVIGVVTYFLLLRMDKRSRELASEGSLAMSFPSLDIIDCQRCGACCVSPSANRKVGYGDYITVDEDDDILGKPDLVQRYVAEGKDHALHIKLTPDGRCKALRGPIGGRVRCEIYHYRPGPCRRVQLGTELCHSYRRDQGLEG